MRNPPRIVNLREQNWKGFPELFEDPKRLQAGPARLCYLPGRPSYGRVTACGYNEGAARAAQDDTWVVVGIGWRQGFVGYTACVTIHFFEQMSSRNRERLLWMLA